ncbi:MAG: hypothetical protein ACSHX9_01625 [Luteolibacter sp.]
MVLLTIIALGLLTLSTVVIRTSGVASADREARANARLALMIAIGELQMSAGPDQRVTASGGILGENVKRPHLTGVWSTKNDGSKPAWLVSGNVSSALGDLDNLSSYPAGYQTPDQDPTGDTFDIFKGDDPGSTVKVSMVDVNEGAKSSGRYAWWVSDEGVKARVDIEAPDGSESGDTERLSRSLAAKESNFAEFDVALKSLGGTDSTINKEALVSYATINLALEDETVSKRFAHDLTIGGYGLPVNVVKGGMKADLSTLFDTSQHDNKDMLETYFGAAPSSLKVAPGTGSSSNKSVIDTFAKVTDTEKFYLAPELTGNLPVGPNWGILYNYGRLWTNVTDGSADPFGMNPPLVSDLLTKKWAPYRNNNTGSFKKDEQHTNSTLSPVLCVMQMGLRLTARSGVVVPETDPPQPGYQLQLQMKPLLGFWNPYNVKISSRKLDVQWYIYPQVRIAANTPLLKTQTPWVKKKYIRANIWMRDIWTQGSGSESRFKLETGNDTDFEPGEIRYYSVEGKGDLAQTNPLTPGWNETGGFNFDLKYSRVDNSAGSNTNGAPGEPIIVPGGSEVWFGSAYLEDTVLPKTIEYYPELGTGERTSSSITVGGGSVDHIVQRIADIWQPMAMAGGGRTPLDYDIPETIESEWVRTGTTTPLPVELVEASPYHIGTWRFFSRNASEALSADKGAGSQKIRSWIDSNPRFGAMNPAWDGSRIVDRSEEGFHFVSPFVGGSYGQTYDGGPGGRGKVAEGQDEAAASPEAELVNGRYRGFGGLTTSSSGQTHVMLFDVPRSPLVSLGQFQHAQLSRYGYEPAFPFGNSHANIRIPLDQTVVNNFAGIQDFKMFDISHAVNESVWDEYFFSTIGIDYKGKNPGGTIDSHFPADELASGALKLPNPRNRFISTGAQKISEIVSRSDLAGPKALAAHIAVEGAFNVNSTSKEAWKAVLSSMADFEFPVISKDGSSVSWEESGGIRLPRFGHVMQAEGWKSSDGATDPAFWNGFREISSDELDDLAENIVSEVRNRGPFRSFADFVNRDPKSSTADVQRKGALQAALDNSINAPLAGTVGDAAEQPQGSLFSDVMDGTESTSGGYAGYMMQGDLLQSLAPVLEVRSDSFRIHAMGQATDDKGNVLATAVCVADVQRTAEYVDPSDEAHLSADPTDANPVQSEANKQFGRRFSIVSFRWLSPLEI